VKTLPLETVTTKSGTFVCVRACVCVCVFSLQDLSATATGKSAVTTTLSSFLNQASVKSLPHAYLKAGQELLVSFDYLSAMFGDCLFYVWGCTRCCCEVEYIYHWQA